LKSRKEEEKEGKEKNAMALVRRKRPLVSGQPCGNASKNGGDLTEKRRDSEAAASGVFEKEVQKRRASSRRDRKSKETAK